MEQLMAGISQSLSAFFPGMTCRDSGDGVPFVFAEGRLVSNLMVAELLGPQPDSNYVEHVLHHVLNTVQDDLLRDWGRWQAPALAAQVDTIKMALPDMWQQTEGWHLGYRLPDGDVLELTPVQL